MPTAEQVSAAVRAWAAAYTSGDPAALRLTVGDPDAGRTYLPLTGAGAAATTVGPCTALDAATVAVRVELTIRWATTQPQTPTAAPATGEPQAPPPAAFDVLVTGSDTAAPRVVAWGGPGTGPALVPYGNAVAGNTTPPPAAAPTVTWVPPTAGSGPAG